MLSIQEDLRQNGPPTKAMLRDDANRARVTRILELQETKAKLLEVEYLLNKAESEADRWREVSKLLAGICGVLLVVLVAYVNHWL